MPEEEEITGILGDIPKDVVALEVKLRNLAHLYKLINKTNVGVQLIKKKCGDTFDDFVKLTYDQVEKGLKKLKSSLSRVIGELAQEHPVYRTFFSHIKGIGPTYAGILLGFSPRMSPKPSSLWFWYGIAPRKVYKERGYKFKWFVKQSLWVIANNFIKQNNNYSAYFRKWRAELLQKRKLKRAVAFGVAVRKMQLMFTGHYFETYWRTFGINPPKPYFYEIGLKQYYVPPEALFDQ